MDGRNLQENDDGGSIGSCDTICSDRAGGTSRRSGNPPAVHFSADFSPMADPPPAMDALQRLDKLASKGFQGTDDESAAFFLDRISYQHASEYFDVFSSVEDPTVSMLHRAILFDRTLQSILMESIGLFELQFRAQYSYALSEVRGAFAHRDPSNFKDRKRYESFLGRYESEFNKQLKNRNPSVQSAYERYGDVPAWEAVEIVSFGILSMLYSNTRSKKVRISVADSFGTTYDNLVSWTRSLAAIRNACAHFNRVAGKRLVSIPKRIPGVEGDNSSIFYGILVLAHLLNHRKVFYSDVSMSYTVTLVGEIMQLFSRYREFVPLFGFPDDWLETITGREVLGLPIDGPMPSLPDDPGTPLRITLFNAAEGKAKRFRIG